MAEKKRKKKNGANTEMGNCPFEYKAGLGAGLGTERAGVRGRDTRRRAAQHERWARRRHGHAGTGARGRGAGRAATRALGEQPHGHWAHVTARARRRALGRREGCIGRAARALGARHERWARGTGAGRAAWACCGASR